MITSLRLIDFKNFADETLRVGPFTVIVGANASGKSNIRDALRFLHGIGRGYTLAEIIGGRYGAGGQVEWDAIRGGANELIRFAQSAFCFHVEMSFGEEKIRYRRKAHYTIRVVKDSTRFVVAKEVLRVGYMTVYTTHPGVDDPVHQQDDDTNLLLRMEKTGEQRKYGHRIAVRPDQPALTQIHEHKRIARAHKDYAQQVIDVLASIRFLDLAPDRIREPAFPGQTVLGDSGENLPTVLQEICADNDRKSVLSEWVRELTPMDVADFEFRRDAITGRVQLVIREANNKTVSAYGASDGTLRFLAMLAALLGPDPARLYIFEEIDNGIHPSRLRLLLDLIEGQTAKGEVQVITTTHSPDLLTMVRDDTFKTISVVCRLPDTADALIRLVTELPDAGELRQAQGLGRLHVSGWMEDALAFTEGRDNESAE